MAREIKTKVWPEKVSGTDKDAKERGIQRPNDWRDPDVIMDFNAIDAVVEPIDRSTGLPDSGTEPEWSQGWYIQDRASGQPVMKFGGEPDEFFKKAWRTGQPIIGVLVIRDNAQHG